MMKRLFLGFLLSLSFGSAMAQDVMNADKVPMLWVPVVPAKKKESDEEE